MSNNETSRLRVALLAGCLERHGAERQAVFMARALRRVGVEVRICSLTRGDHYEEVLRNEGFSVQWSGQLRNPLLRVLTVAKQLRRFRPHVVQATLGHNNIHAALVARLLKCISLGALRTDLARSKQTVGRWTPYLFKLPTGVIVNSTRAEQQLRESGFVDPDRIHLLPNVVDLAELNGDAEPKEAVAGAPVTAIFLSRLVALKRLDVFLRALAKARKSEGALRGLVVGDGPEREPMQRLASELGLTPEHVEFTGESHNPIEQMRRSDFLVLCSDHEGSPNSVLEAMAIAKPVVVTPAGDAPVIVQDGRNGYVVDFGDVDGLAEKMAELARSPRLRTEMGRAARERIEASYSMDGLAERLVDIYTRAASRRQSNLPRPADAIPEGPSRLARQTVEPPTYEALGDGT